MQKEPIGRWSFVILAAGAIYAVINIIGIASRFPDKNDIGLALFTLLVLAACFMAAWVVRRLP